MVGRADTVLRSLIRPNGLVVGLLFFFFFLLFFFRFVAADFLEALVERRFAEEIGRKIRIVFAGGEEDLAGAVAIAVLRDLHRGTNAIH
jgi:hypothetical protein